MLCVIIWIPSLFFLSFLFCLLIPSHSWNVSSGTKLAFGLPVFWSSLSGASAFLAHSLGVWWGRAVSQSCWLWQNLNYMCSELNTGFRGLLSQQSRALLQRVEAHRFPGWVQYEGEENGGQSRCVLGLLHSQLFTPNSWDLSGAWGCWGTVRAVFSVLGQCKRPGGWGAVHIYPGLLPSYWWRKAYLTKIDQVSKCLNRYSRSVWLPDAVTSICTFRVPHTLHPPHSPHTPSRSLSLFFFAKDIRICMSLVFLPGGFPHKSFWVHRLDEWLVTCISGSLHTAGVRPCA